MSYLEKTTSRFLITTFSRKLYSGDAEKILDQIQEIISEIDDELQIIIFINKILEANEKSYQEHLKDCKDKANCVVNFQHEKLLFKLNKLLKFYGQVTPNTDIFTTEEKHSLDVKLNEILDQLETLLNDQEKLKNGQEVIFNEFTELKDMHFLGKKNWKQLAAGKIAEMVVGGFIAEATSKHILDSLTTDLPKLLP